MHQKYNKSEKITPCVFWFEKWFISDMPSFHFKFQKSAMQSTVYTFKGALDNFSLIPPIFFKKVEIFIPLEV